MDFTAREKQENEKQISPIEQPANVEEVAEENIKPPKRVTEPESIITKGVCPAGFYRAAIVCVSADTNDGNRENEVINDIEIEEE